MKPNVIFPDAVFWATDYLRDALAARPEDYTADVYVGDKLPVDDDNKPTRDDRMVIVQRAGGRRLDGARESARLGINVWALNDSDVNDLSRMVRALLWAGADGAPVVRVDDQSGPTEIPDESGQPCRYLVLELIVRGESLTA